MAERTRRRPWLAALLALVVSGLGHAYLRRWARALGWYVAVTAAVFVFVPESAISGVFAGDPPTVREVAPAAAVVGASVIDAYVVALRNNRAYEREREAALATGRTESTDHGTAEEPNAPSAGTAEEPNAPSTRTTDDGGTVRCPECGKETDPTFDFCQWCAEPVGEDDA
ncbi:zinc ribbon domain-containing protein [Halorubrum trapanicum]|uniref:zinc ribbon domain-containing protein n=1 Tax=Halorubrum trapanicum TaxID=29284 RepID=UPI000BBA6402|nr:zinc ribbon domain-containing protein [Halorubrum trapanicum]